MKLYGEYFYGNKASDYAIQHGYLDYATLAKAFDAVLNNDIMRNTCNIGEWECVSGFGFNEDEQEELPDTYQHFIVSNKGAEILEEIDEILFYNETLNMYVWGVTHLGTGWDYVLTGIKLNCGEEAFEYQKGAVEIMNENYNILEEIIETYELTGEDVLRIITDWHGLEILTDEFIDNLKDVEGYEI